MDKDPRQHEVFAEQLELDLQPPKSKGQILEEQLWLNTQNIWTSCGWYTSVNNTTPANSHVQIYDWHRWTA